MCEDLVSLALSLYEQEECGGCVRIWLALLPLYERSGVSVCEDLVSLALSL